MFFSLLLYLLMFVFVIVSVGFKLDKIGFKKINLKREIPLSVFYLLLLFGAAILIGAVFYSLGFGEDMSQVPSALKQVGILEILIVMLIGSFVEEIFFRGYLQRKTNIWVASFIFAYFHIVYGSLTELVGAFFLGMILGIAFKKTNNLFVPILSHVLYNIIVIALIFTAAT